ncbi:MAG: hypothetical protein FWC26_03445 [Fibromonadales bacterium]|nr:hypothetical protein [Fibromonadales bacterium]
MNRAKSIFIGIGILLALTLTFSCSSNEGNDNEGSEISTTRIYTMKDVTNNSFVVVDAGYFCDNGKLEMHIDDEPTISYAIDNKILTLYSHWWFTEPINFNGTSNSLKGTWTRTPNFCNDCSDVSKVTFTSNTFSITRKYCATHMESNRESFEHNGFTLKVIDCNNYEVSKGNDKISVKYVSKGYNSYTKKITHNNKSVCEVVAKELSYSELEKECKEYGNFKTKMNDFMTCIAELNLPSEFGTIIVYEFIM